jgi:hypothetical protein
MPALRQPPGKREGGLRSIIEQQPQDAAGIAGALPNLAADVEQHEQVAGETRARTLDESPQGR